MLHIRFGKIDDVVYIESPSDYIESSDYFSRERFFTALLVEKTRGSYLQYSKSRLNAKDTLIK